MQGKKKVCVVTSTRADYGLLFWLLKRIEASDLLQLELTVTGTHLSSQHGSTYKFIEADGFKINKKIPILGGGGVSGVGSSAGKALTKFTQYFFESKPEAIILLGDRFEILAVAQAAAIVSIPVIHLHGGEITEGANDDMFRHAISKLSAYHFTSNQEHRNRVIQMGEQTNSVKTAGALGIENIRKLGLLKRSELEKKYEFKFQKHVFLITFHPATLDKESPEKQFIILLKAITTFKNVSFIISKANADAGGDKINKLIDEFAKQNKNTLVSYSFGQLNYLSLMKLADVVIGNSSSGIIEAPSLLTPTVNVGARQRGRMSADSVIHCNVTAKEIIKAITRALALKNKKSFKNPYDHGNSSEKIVTALEKLDFETLLPKKFYDLS